jgi:hypothetical protein
VGIVCMCYRDVKKKTRSSLVFHFLRLTCSHAEPLKPCAGGNGGAANKVVFKISTFMSDSKME